MEQDHNYMLGVLSGKLDALLSHAENLTASLKEHDTRIKTLEHSRSWLLGGGATISAIVAALISIFTRQ